MRILHTVERYLPQRNGMQEVVTQLSERLVKMGHHVTVATLADPGRKEKVINDVEVKEFDVSGNTISGFSGATKEYQDFLINGEFDVVVNFAAQQWATDLALPILRDIPSRKVFVPTGFSALEHPLYKSYYEKMGTWMKGYDTCVFLSDDYRDINFSRAHGIDRNVIIPNAASLEEFEAGGSDILRKELGIREEEFLVLHVGSFTGVKGHFQALNIFRKAKIKNAVLLLTGNEPVRSSMLKVKNILKCLSFGLLGVFPSGKLYYRIFAFLHNLWLPNRINKKRIIVTELKRKDVVAAYKAADLFLFPSMIECSPIVLFESMAAKTAFLVTDVGNSKEIIQWSDGGRLMATEFDRQGYSIAQVKAAASALENMYEDTGLRAKLAASGYLAVVRRFNWQKIAEEYEQLYLQLLKPQRT